MRTPDFHSYCTPKPAVAFICDVCHEPGQGTPQQKRHVKCQPEWLRRYQRGEIKSGGIHARRMRRNATV